MQVATRQGPAYGVAPELIGWIQSFVGTSNSGTGLGGIGGGLFGRD